jgi:hypothetical protein
VLAAASYGGYEQPASTTSVYPAGLDLSKAAHRGGGGYMTDYVADYMADYKYAAVPPQQQGDYSTETRRLGYSSSQTAGMETPVTTTTTAAGYCHPDLTAACYRGGGDSSRQQQQQQQQQQHKSVITSAGVIRRSAAGSRGHGGGVKSPETAAGDTASSQYHDTATAGERRSVGL